MYFAVITILPEMFTAISEFGITGRAVQNKQVTIECINPRDFTIDNYRRIDERPFGGGPGMVMMPAPLPNGTIPAVQTSFGDRNKLKSRTSRLFLPSRKRTLTALTDAVELTTDSSELNALPAPSVRVV